MNPRKPKRKRYDGYQVGMNRPVSSLTEEEAKIHLAKAMDAIKKLHRLVEDADEVIFRWRIGE